MIGLNYIVYIASFETLSQIIYTTGQKFFNTSLFLVVTEFTKKESWKFKS